MGVGLWHCFKHILPGFKTWFIAKSNLLKSATALESQVNFPSKVSFTFSRTSVSATISSLPGGRVSNKSMKSWIAPSGPGAVCSQRVLWGHSLWGIYTYNIYIYVCMYVCMYVEPSTICVVL